MTNAPPAPEAPASPPFAGAESYEAVATPHPADVMSLRSRASSIVSTGTKTSITTLPQPVPASGSVDVVLGQRSFRITARPGSVLSISSWDQSLPPYSEAAGSVASYPTTTTATPNLPAPSPSPSPSPPGTPTGTTAAAPDASPALPRTSTPPPAPPSPLPAPTPQSTTRSTFLNLLPSARRTSTRPSQPSHSHSHSRSRATTTTIQPSILAAAVPAEPPPSPLIFDPPPLAGAAPAALAAHTSAVLEVLGAERVRQAAWHARELARTRNAIDAAYRGELRRARQAAERAATDRRQAEAAASLARYDAVRRGAEREGAGREVAELREEVARARRERDAARKEVEEAVRRARNEVEDLWEGRWRDRMGLAAEEAGKANEDRRRVWGGWEEVVGERFGGEVAGEVKREVERRLREGRGRRRSSGKG